MASNRVEYMDAAIQNKNPLPFLTGDFLLQPELQILLVYAQLLPPAWEYLVRILRE